MEVPSGLGTHARGLTRCLRHSPRNRLGRWRVCSLMNRTRVGTVAWHSIVLATISVALIGCKDVGRDMAACKIKAMEVYKPAASVETDDRASEYVRSCMEAMGYRLLPHCVGGTVGTAGYTYLSC